VFISIILMFFVIAKSVINTTLVVMYMNVNDHYFKPVYIIKSTQKINNMYAQPFVLSELH